MGEMLNKFIPPSIQHDAEIEHTQIRNSLGLYEKLSDYEQIIKELTYNHERFTDERLSTSFNGITLDNPLIVAPGWDKPGVAVRALYDLGFGAIEVGSIMQFPQEGNPRPRHFWLTTGVPLNRYGFNSPGMEVTAQNLEAYKSIPMGINIGKNKIIPDEEAPQTYAAVTERLYDYATYFVINVSSPNTPGLRALQNKEPLTKIITAVNQVMDEKKARKPLFVKIAPDLSTEDINDVIDVVLKNGLSGIIATNTTLNSEIKAKYGEHWRDEMGGVSGDDPDFRLMSTNIIKHIYKQAGKKLTIIGVGGIKDTETALEKIKAGASAIQTMASLDVIGPHLPGIINRGLVAYMDKEGIKHISDLVGVNAA